MNLWLVKLKFLSPLHIGKAGIGMEAVENYVHSDTLFGGLCHAWSEIYGSDAATEMIEGFRAGKLSFTISSAFPFIDDIFFLPRPLMPPKINSSLYDSSVLKDLNRLTFLPLATFKNWVRHEYIQADNIPAIKEALAASMIYHRLPRVQLDRVTCASGLFHAGMTVFGAGAGLYCLVRVEEPSVRDKLEGVFQWLGESGLGGMRSLGYGKFVPEWHQAGEEWLELWQVDLPAGWCLLSLMHPNEREKTKSLDNAYFEIISRDGWAASPLSLGQVRRKECKMFAEGTVLTYQPEGCMVDVTPGDWDKSLHPLYRYGVAFAVPVEVKD